MKELREIRRRKAEWGEERREIMRPGWGGRK